MLLDLFKPKKDQPAGSPAPLPTPAAQRAPVQPQPRPVQPQAQSVQPQAIPPPRPQPSPQPVPQQVRPVQQPLPQQAQPSPQPVQRPLSASQVTAEDIYPVILKRVKEEFKNVSGEAEKLRALDTKLERVSKSFENFNKFMEDSKTQIKEMKNKTDNFDVALYELVTNQFNPFIKNQKAQTHNVAQVPSQPADPFPQQAEPVGPTTEPATVEPISQTDSEGKEKIDREFEEELKKALAETDGETAPTTDGDQEIKQIVVEDNINQNQEPVHIVDHGAEQEQEFLDKASQLTPGAKQDETEQDETEHDERKIIRERIQVEDVLNVPEEDSKSDEVTETLSFRETYNDPDAKHLNQTPPKLKRFDLKELLGRFMAKHEAESTTIPEYTPEGKSQEPIVEKHEEKPKEHLPERSKEHPKGHHKEPVHKKPFVHPAEDHHKEVHPSTHHPSTEQIILSEEKKRIVEKNITDPKQYFWFENGKVAKSIPEFIMILKNLDDVMYDNHVKGNNNDFANWVRGVFNSDIIANKMSQCKTRKEMIKLLS